MTQETKDKICQVCAHSANCGFTIRSLQDKCPTIQRYDDGYSLGYEDAVNKACELYQKELEEISILMGRLRKKSKDLIDITASVEQFKKAML